MAEGVAGLPFAGGAAPSGEARIREMEGSTRAGFFPGVAHQGDAADGPARGVAQNPAELLDPAKLAAAVPDTIGERVATALADGGIERALDGRAVLGVDAREPARRAPPRARRGRGSPPPSRPRRSRRT
jgi:hypothetical protein